MTVQVYFTGVCTHVRLDPLHTPWLREATKAPHRVVLANARKENPLGDVRIPPHISTLSISRSGVRRPPPGSHPPQFEALAGADSFVWNLRGVRIELDPETTDGDLTHKGWRVPRLPHVNDFAVSRAVVIGDDPRLADAYFDVHEGTLSSWCNDKAYAARLTVEGQAPLLVVTPFGGAPLFIPLLPNAEIRVEHYDPQGCDGEDRDHFRLHYLIGGGIPEKAKGFTGEECADARAREPVPRGPVSVGVGCSSSEYP